MLDRITMRVRCRNKEIRRAAGLMLIFLVSLGVFAAAGAGAERVYAADRNGRYSLGGAKYQLYSDKACTEAAADANGKNALLITDAEGKANTLKMAAGTYYAKEVSAGTGYGLDPRVYTVTVTDANTSSVPAAFTSAEPPAYGVPRFIIYKTSAAKDDEDYRKLLGAEFTVKYYDVAAKEDIAGASPKDWWTFTTVKKVPPSYDDDPTHYYAGFDWQNDAPVASSRPDKSFYTDENGSRVLPLGWFTIEETKAPGGYRLTDKIVYGQIRQTGQGTAAVTEIEGADAGGGAAVEITFKNEPNRVSIKKTDASSGKALAGAKLQLLQGNVVKDEWLSSDKPHVMTGLPAGTYTLRELAAPYGYDISDDITFKVTGDSDMEVAMKNTPVTLKTTAVDSSTGSAYGITGKNEKITDTVHLSGLHKGRKYRVSGTLMDKATGDPVKSGGKEVTAQTDFTAEAETMDVKVTFDLDSSSFRPGDKKVVFEKLFRTSAVHNEKVPAEIQKHEDINDSAQTITYPGISTSAAISDDCRVIRDTVTYENLMPGEKYIIRGWLVDTVSGEKVPGSDGSAELTAGTSGSGSMEMALPAEGYESMPGHSITAFEELYLIVHAGGKETEVLVAAHKDKEDKDQTAEIYHDLIVEKTVTGRTGNHEREFLYRVVFTGLVPGQSYTVEGDDAKVFNADPSGRAEVPLRLADEQSVTIKQLPKGSQYQIIEIASDHSAEFSIWSEDMDGQGAKIVMDSGSNHDDPSEDLSTALETVDLLDGTVCVMWENSREPDDTERVPPDTGDREDLLIYAAAALSSAAMLMILAAVMRIRKKKGA